jgi:hypothetical protein
LWQHNEKEIARVRIVEHSERDILKVTHRTLRPCDQSPHFKDHGPE